MESRGLGQSVKNNGRLGTGQVGLKKYLGK